VNVHEDLQHHSPPLLAARPGSRQAYAPIPVEAPQEVRIRILVADDEADSRAALTLALGTAYDVVGAADGAEAVAFALAAPPDLILLDLMMPRLDGFQVLQALRSDPTTAEVPVLVVSARREDADKVRGLGLGAMDYLEKPFSVPELRARVERTVRLIRAQRALQEQAQTDPLTGLANRRALLTRLEAECRRAARYRTHLTCVMADLDGLKSANDELGHAAGDAVLTAVADHLRGELRETDFGARIGGDEFVVVLPHTDAAAGRVYAERVCARLRDASFILAGRRVPLGASFGVACQVPDGDVQGAEALLEAADGALYRAKAAGRGRVVVAGAEDEADPEG
jgi:diguanylate cyclase (GGDEF)-like protein